MFIFPYSPGLSYSCLHSRLLLGIFDSNLNTRWVSSNDLWFLRPGTSSTRCSLGLSAQFLNYFYSFLGTHIKFTGSILCHYRLAGKPGWLWAPEKSSIVSNPEKTPNFVGPPLLFLTIIFWGLTLQGTEEPQQFFSLLCLGPHPPLPQHSLCGGRDTQFKFLVLTQSTKSIEAHHRSTALWIEFRSGPSST